MTAGRLPIRIQRKRTRGWKAPDGAVYVGRPSKWGNPFVVDERAKVTSRTIAVACFRAHLTEQGTWSPIPKHQWPKGKIPAQWTTVEDVRRELRGKDLMCWCPLDKPCHADVLLELANAPTAPAPNGGAPEGKA